jgi:hypothetical protein
MSAAAGECVRSEHALDRIAEAYASALEEVAAGVTARVPIGAARAARSGGVALGA